jgi:hypothetical protein
MPTLNVFLDESGNFDFSNNSGASEWLLLTSVATADPSEGVAELYAAKHALIAEGFELEYFHASEDRQAVRDKVFQVIRNMESLRIDGLAVRKRKLNPAWRVRHEFYPRMIEYLLRYTFHHLGVDVRQYDRVHLFMDKVQLPRREKEALFRGIKQFMARHLGGMPYQIMMHSSCAHLYLQVADYCCWALSVRRERNEGRPYEAIRRLVRSDYDIFASGSKNWY